MSILITEKPEYITFSDNPMFYTFSTSQYSETSGQPKLKLSFIVDVTIGGYGDVAKIEIFPEYFSSTDAFGRVNVSNLVSLYLKEFGIKPFFDFHIIYDNGGYASVTITVTEKYTTNVSIDPTLYNSVTSDSIFAVKGSLPMREFNSFDFNKFDPNSPGARFLTDKPYKSLYGGQVNLYEYDFKKEDTFCFSYLDPNYSYTGAPLTTKYLYVSLTNASGGTVWNYTVDYLGESQGTVNRIFFNLENQKRNGYLTQSQLDQTQNITLMFMNADLDFILCVIHLKCVDPCFYPGKSVQWLNKYGGYDYYLFQHNERKSANIKSYEYGKPLGQFDFYGNFNATGYNSGRNNYIKETTDKLQLISGYLDQDEQNWLTQLYESPLVYLNEGETFENAIITNTTYQIKQDQYDELYNEIVEIEFNNRKSVLL